ncbi:hypothetical protein PV327_005315 [Microctonus hyperodae]|uniref:Uncharacterized protein n=1 Tax=Microctonus hyperodae TaxID=165561 RepID=A0AA39KZL3_MICHY|nr:hypothetical protein PV327_005315 [Microctonus hyperodae]
MSCKRKIDLKYSYDYGTMETEVRSLKQELTRTREALKSATKRCRELVRELDSLNVCHESERTLRDQQLSRILRALLVLESRLRQEQKSIRQQLCEKDNVIRNQQLEIARLRRYTKNYIKNKREQGTNKNSPEKNDVNKNCEDLEATSANTTAITFEDGSLDKDIQSLKREIVIKLNHQEDVKNRNKDCGVRKTDSFAGSDVSKESLTSEITDGSIITTTTDGSASLLSTEGFCEGESSDISPGSTLNKSCSRRTTSDSDTELTRTILNDLNDQTSENNDNCGEDYDDDDDDNDNYPTPRRIGITRTEPLQINENGVIKMSRSDSKDDGLDCTFVSEDDEQNEPIYVNTCTENNAKNLQDCDNRLVDKIKFSNDNERVNIPQEEKNLEDGNWYSDPDEDRISDDVFRHNSSYRPNSNHNSVLECVNQILLRDMEEEENVSSVPRTFKHRGRIVRFQSARLSDIESVGSEMERRNSEETTMDKELTETGNFENACSEDEFGMRVDPPLYSTINSGTVGSESSHEEELEDSQLTRAIPIVIIEPNEDIDVRSDISSVSPDLSMKSKTTNRSSSPILRLERIEEKTCLSMSSKGLTIAKNLDYEDIESLPEIISPSPKTPPALPPKPQFRNNTLILKKIPSPSFLIDETRKKHSPIVHTPAYVKNIFGISSPSKLSKGLSSRSLVFEDKAIKTPINNNNFKDNNKSKSLSKFKNYKDHIFCDTIKAPRVTNIVRHFEEFKIGSDTDNRRKTKSLDRRPPLEIEEMDIRQNFEEFNLDECDLSDDPDRPDGDGSDRLGKTSITNKQDNDSYNMGDNNNSGYINNNSNGIYDHFLEATGLSTKSILTPSRLLSNHKSMLKPKDIKYKNKIKAVGTEKHNNVLPTSGNANIHVRHWSGPFV